MNLQLVPCPLCSQSKMFIDVVVPNIDAHIHSYGSLYAGKKISEWKICGSCGFVHQNPRPTIVALNDYYMHSSYHENPAVVESEGYLKFSRWYFTEKIDFALRESGVSNGSVFDIGCGRGGVLKLYEERGWKSFGVEPDQNLANYAINEFGLKGVKQGILDSHFEIEEKMDIVVSNHAFEHFADLDEAMIGVKNILKPGGYIFVAIPTYFKNKSSLSKLWMNSAHYSLFTHNSLNNLLARYGFEEISHTYSGWKKEVDDLWYIAKLTNKVHDSKIHFENPEAVSRYLRIINPLRSFVFYPVYSNWVVRVRIYTLVVNALKLLITSPSTFVKKLLQRINLINKA